MSMFAGATGKNPTLRGTGFKQIVLPNFTPEQTSLFSQQAQRLQPNGFLGRLAEGDQSQFEQMEAPALRQFGALQGNIASRFSGMGSGARRSSGFANTMSSAAQEFAERLQGNRLGLQMQAQTGLSDMINQLLGQRPYENALVAKKKPFWQELLAGLMPGFGSGAGSMGSMYGASKLGLI